MNERSQIGIVFPQIEIGDDPGAVRAFAQASETLGFEGLMLYDHVVGADLVGRPNWDGWYDNQHSFHEVFVVLGFIAAITTRIRLVTGIVILPQRQTALVAKQAAEVDVLSGGRLTLGVAVGWNDVEYTALNEDFSNRGKRCAEQIEVMRALWTEDSVDFVGEFHHLPQVGIKPRPVQQPIPIWIGGQADAVLRRTARLGDGWLPMGGPAECQQLLTRLTGYCEEAGRDLKSLAIVATLALEGSDIDGVARQIEAWRVLGVNHFYLDTMKAGLQGPDEHLRAAETFRQLFTS